MEQRLKKKVTHCCCNLNIALHFPIVFLIISLCSFLGQTSSFHIHYSKGLYSETANSERGQRSCDTNSLYTTLCRDSSL